MKEVISSGQLNLENKLNEQALKSKKMCDKKRKMIDNFRGDRLKY